MRCAEAERLAQAAVAHQQRLRDVRRQLIEVVTLRESDSRVRDRRQLSVTKDEARAAYNARLIQAKGAADVREAARVWLREIDRLNRQVTLADRRADEVTRRANELEKALPGVELAADAARIAAESAQAACIDARRALAACEEEAQRRIRATSTAGEPFAVASTATSSTASGAASATAVGRAATQAAPGGASVAPGATPRRLVRPISLVLRGDRKTLLALALSMAEETGVEAGRLQLLLLELREQLAARALEEHFLRFPDGHPFWSQFPGGGARPVATSLASMGYRFDGHSGWLDGRAPTIRELAIALSHVGFDPRGLRRPASQEAIDQLWQGTNVAVEEYLARQAPELDLEQVIACLGPRAAGLAELWDMWGRLRTLLLTPA